MCTGAIDQLYLIEISILLNVEGHDYRRATAVWLLFANISKVKSIIFEVMNCEEA